MSADPGAQAERTRLAWRRTALAATVCALLLARLSATRGLDVAGTVGLSLTALVWLGLLWTAQHRIRAMAVSDPAVVGRTLTAVALSCVGLGLLGVLLILA
ncbi:hypothetical protein Cs7R123_72900 [Catellatospora sp. TT07R-123]|uniref:DUF202 domain-containing protein n=1 Tax=Catellatospora sp. TT07R-123 TaxID=2733863 RepID=UPI001B04EFBD|nr:DUF202 domain-containing protein [Catellatospora sp. TT07R-123]GHJ49948.1 hypothetical protein Cs7R123_72900 [Catellatospora sp. TT07R-123]